LWNAYIIFGRLNSFEKTHVAVARLTQVILGLALVVAAGAKGFDVVRFGRTIEILLGIYGEKDTTTWINLCFLVACFVITLELVLGGMLLAGYRTRLAARAALFMLSFFALIIIHELLTSPETECGCFGTLVERSAGEALLEDMLLIVFAVLAGLEQFRGGRSALIVTVLLTLSGVAWTAVLYLNPPAGTAARIGSLWRFSAAQGEQIIWIFDPECLHCQEQVELLNRINQRDDLPDVVGCTAASAGRIEEFRWDFEPNFDIEKVPEREYDRIYLPAGSLVLVKNQRIGRIWRPTMITEHFVEAFKSGMAR
jgi:hypothetical protein